MSKQTAASSARNVVPMRGSRNLPEASQILDEQPHAESRRPLWTDRRVLVDVRDARDVEMCPRHAIVDKFLQEDRRCDGAARPAAGVLDVAVGALNLLAVL